MISSDVVDDDAVPQRSGRARWVVFVCGGSRYGIALEWVLEILDPGPCTRLPGAGEEVCGLRGIRGRPVTVLDLGVVLGMRPAAALPLHRVLLLGLGGRRIGAAVEAIVAIESAEVEGVAYDDEMKAVLGTAEVAGERFTALDPVRLTEDLLQPA
jgi:chemotaxis signal transduction protein